jgi:hypothetical protein
MPGLQGGREVLDQRLVQSAAMGMINGHDVSEPTPFTEGTSDAWKRSFGQPPRWRRSVGACSYSATSSIRCRHSPRKPYGLSPRYAGCAMSGGTSGALVEAEGPQQPVLADGRGAPCLVPRMWGQGRERRCGEGAVELLPGRSGQLLGVIARPAARLA